MIDRNNGDQSVMDCEIRSSEKHDRAIAELQERIDKCKADYGEIVRLYPATSTVWMQVQDIPVDVLREYCKRNMLDFRFCEVRRKVQVQMCAGSVGLTIWLYSPEVEVVTHLIETTAIKNI